MHLPVIPLFLNVRSQGRVHHVPHPLHPRRIVLDMHRDVVRHKPDKRLVRVGILSPDKRLGGRDGDKIDHHVEGGEAGPGVNGGDVCGQELLGGRGGEGGRGVVNQPEGHGDNMIQKS